MTRRSRPLFNPRWNTAARPAVPERMVDLLAAMRASYLVYRNAHWQVSGDGFYAKHQLLQRLYEDTEKSVDKLAERIVGYYGGGAVDLAGLQSDRIGAWVARAEGVADCPIERSLRAAKDVRDAIQAAYQEVKGSGTMTLGLDDLLMSLSSEKDEHVYLLEQTLEGHEVKLVDRAANPATLKRRLSHV